MTNSIVLDLQREVLDGSVAVSDLLRKALVIARKLRLTEFEAWVDKELNGYENGDVPQYRELRGEPRFRNPVHGWLPITFGPNAVEAADALSKGRCDQSIAEIEALHSGKGQLMMPYAFERQAAIGKAIGFQTQSALFVPKTHLVGIIDTVRNILLNWSLKLEEDGILGEGFTFTKEEQQAAVASPQQATYYIGHISGAAQFHQGPGTAIQINHPPIDPTTVASFLRTLKGQLPKLDLPDPEKAEMTAEIESIEAQTRSPKPKQTIFREGLGSLRRILEGAGGGIAAQLLSQLGQILGAG